MADEDGDERKPSMHIKKVKLSGFKSYSEEKDIAQFHPRHNAIVGLNGAGKSNFFEAIQFVLQDPSFRSYSKEERAKLLHEGAGKHAMLAYVEVTLDNSDKRIPSEKDEVRLRRTCGTKTDDYYLNDKHIRKEDVTNLLESAGFSRSNPYYIVRQGKIQTLATVSDAERLNLLKEVAGTNVYDDRRTKSLTIMDQTKEKRSRINEMLERIEERLQELDGERKELGAFNKVDKRKRNIENTIFQREKEIAREKYDELDRQIAEIDGQLGAMEEAVSAGSEGTASVADLETAIAKDRAALGAKEDALATLEEERQELLQRKAQLQLQVKDLETNQEEEATRVSDLKKRRKGLKKFIASKDKEFDQAKKDLDEAETARKQAESKLHDAERKQNELRSKESRHAQFTSKRERDAFLQSEIKTLKKDLGSRQRYAKDLDATLAKLRKSVKLQAADKAERSEGLQECHQTIERESNRLIELQQQRDELSEQRKDQWKKQSELDKLMGALQDTIHRSQRELLSTTAKVIRQGIESVKTLLREDRGGELRGVHGPLIELISCQKNFYMAVQATANNALFNVVVDNDRTGSLLLRRMRERKLPGRITILPLNRLHPRDQRYPPDAKLTIPMVERLTYPPEIAAAIKHVFGRTVVCKNLEIASDVAKTHNLDGITLDGHKVHRKGALTGGYRDTKKQRLQLQADVTKAQAEHDDKATERDSLRDKLQAVDEAHTRVMSKITETENKLSQSKHQIKGMRAEGNAEGAKHDSALESIELKAKGLTAIKEEIKALESNIASLASELEGEFESQLEDDEQAQLLVLASEVEELQPLVVNAIKTHEECEQRFTELKTELQDNLKRALHQIEEDLEDAQVRDEEHSLKQKHAELKRVEAELVKSKGGMKQGEKAIGELQQSVADVAEQIERARETERNQQAQDTALVAKREKLDNKRQLSQKKMEECAAKLRSLISSDGKELEELKKYDLKRLYKLLSSTQKELQKYKGVNKKALEQYQSFEEQRANLNDRKKEQDDAEIAIVDLIENLDMKKNEAIALTFKQVAVYFSQVFRDLVPHGQGKLIMLRAEESSQAEKGGARGVESYVGVSISVSFSRDMEAQSVHQLSGGQKTLVALALIFAIQRCDPAPFYLFDEIDAALDEQYRHAVASVVEKMAQNAQFITTTFSADLVKKADRCYGVTFENKISHIQECSRKKALDFLKASRNQKEPAQG